MIKRNLEKILKNFLALFCNIIYAYVLQYNKYLNLFRFYDVIFLYSIESIYIYIHLFRFIGVYIILNRYIDII